MLFQSQCSLKHLREWEEIRFRQVIIHQERLRWCAHEVIIEQNRKQSPTPLGELNFTICHNQQLLEVQLSVLSVSTTHRRRTFVNQNVLTKHLLKHLPFNQQHVFGVLSSSITRLLKLIRGKLRQYSYLELLVCLMVFFCFKWWSRSKMYNFTCHS